MHTSVKIKPRRGALLPGILAALLVAGGGVRAAWAATVTIDLCATAGTTILPPATSVPFWGYALGDCSGTPAPTLPGPTLDVNQGDNVTVVLHNRLAEATALLFPGQAMIPDTVGAAALGGTATYTFTAANPGTYPYEAGLLPNAQHQTALGLYGALVVRSATAGQAYNSATTAYDTEALVLLSEIDPALNNAASPATFDLRNYAPKYFLINGRAYPQTAAIPVAAAGDRVLLRYLNAGLQHHSPSLLGLHQTVVARDGALLNFSQQVVAEPLAPGQTIDAIATIPLATAAGAMFALHDGNLMLHNGNAPGFGGMLTFLAVGPATPGPDTGPLASSVTLAPNPADGAVAVVLSASLSDAATGNSNVTAAEYFIDSPGAPGTGTAMSGASGSPTVTVSATVATAALGGLASGSHTLYVRGRDALGNWGAFNFAVLNLDKAGPATTGLALAPNPGNGTANVALSATGDDRATGNSPIVAAEYSIDGGTASAMAVAPPGAAIVSLDISISAATVAALAEGVHTVSVRSRDALNHWGPAATVSLFVDKTGPVPSGVSAAPNPNNGSLGVNSTTPAVRVSATFTDAAAAIATAEAFIDAVGASGSGFPMIPNDGVFNGPAEAGYADIPLSTVALLASGPHTIFTHGKDAAGNWGASVSAALVIDRTPPVLSGVSAAPNPTGAATSVTLTAAANDSGSAVVKAEWFTGIDPGNGNGTAMTLSGTGPWSLTATINIGTWAWGGYLLNVRARDAAGNWSLIGTAVLKVPGLVFSTLGDGTVPGTAGPFDDADIYSWNGTAFSRVWDARIGTVGLPTGANIDGLSMVDATHFYLSFSGGTTNLPGLGNVQDEDVVYYNNGVWSVFFDGTARGLTAAAQDLDEIDVKGGILYFSTLGNGTVPGVAGPFDDADIYSWNGTTFSRVWDASAHGLAAGANIDGLSLIDATHFFLSFSGATTTVPGLGAVQDEDVVYYNNGVWSLYFDGTARGLTGDTQDLDAIH